MERGFIRTKSIARFKRRENNFVEKHKDLQSKKNKLA